MSLIRLSELSKGAHICQEQSGQHLILTGSGPLKGSVKTIWGLSMGSTRLHRARTKKKFVNTEE